ncbi:thioredoxin domain-containing protein 16-like [Biomphalaria glabrata]|uniref:Thioredoxin domain-containing protein 16-like n=1 Tax=Biomphalaria glabrata TaxID=6526 RepID=A0A9U8E213_BIOGL|nr:thioredoxin domain-containing protein 16-like [Biomphalaria glabrata]
MMLASLYMCLVIAGTTVFGETQSDVQKKSQTQYEFKNVYFIKPSEIDELSKSSTLLHIYFIASETYYSTLKSLFDEMENAAKYLKSYNIKIAVLDCLLHTEETEYCAKKDVRKNFFTFKNGNFLLKLDLETLFDVESIMAHSIHLLSIDKVPVLLSRLERMNLESKIIGVKDLIFAYFPLSGTREHRIFAEVAYAYQDNYNFAFTAETKVTEGLQNANSINSESTFAIWAMFCSTSTHEQLQSGDCDNIMYKGDTNLAAIATFIRLLGEPVLYYSPSKDALALLEMPGSVPILFVYTEETSNQMIEKDVQELAHFVRGHAKLVVLNMDKKKNKKIAQEHGYQGSIPNIAFLEKPGEVTYINRPWSLESAQEFLEATIYLSDKPSSEVVKKSQHSPETDIFSESLIEEVETQDDEVEDAVFRLQLEDMDLSFMPPLFKETFAAAIDSAQLKLVLFYLPFDHVSMAFLSDLAKAATNFSGSDVLMRVNCFDATDLCAAQNITSYPLMRIYQKGMKPQEYKGHLHSQSVLIAYILLQLKSPVKLNTQEEVDKFMKGHFPMSFSSYSPSSVILLAAKENKEVRLIFKKVAKSLSTVTAFGIVTKKLVASVAKKYGVMVPAVVAYNRQDVDKPIRILTDVTEETLRDFAWMSTFKTLPELGINNFPTLFAKKLPFAILFVDKNSTASLEAMKMMTKIALSGQFDNVIFCSMNAQPKTLGIKILSSYAWTATLPMISLVNHRQAEVFNYAGKLLKDDEVTSWLKDVLLGLIPPSKHLEQASWNAPGKYYDFLAMTDSLKEIENTANQNAIDQDKSNDTEKEELIDQLLKEDEAARAQLLQIRKLQLHEGKNHVHTSEEPQSLKQESTPIEASTHIEL